MNISDIGIGTDIEKISRFEEYKKDDELIKRVFSPLEIEYCFSFKNPASHLAVRYSAKEAVYKALSSVNTNSVNYSDIEIYNLENGVPNVRILKDGFENYDFKVSLSHGNGSSLASVIVIKK